MKKVIAFILTAILALGIAIPAMAADAQITADIVGYSDARVEQKDLSNIPSVAEYIANPETEAKEFKISTALELTAVSIAESRFSGITLYLANDIDMTGVNNFKPIGGGASEANTKPFRGTFDGQGYTIDNLVVDYGTTQHVGLFGNVQGATIKNVILGEGCSFKGGNRTGGIVGGITGDKGMNTTVDNCWNKATVEGTSAMIGGIVGYSSVTGVGSYNVAGQKVTQDEFNEATGVSTHTVTNCTNTGAITAAARDAGGIVGTSNVKITVTNCRNAGAVESKAMDKNTRGTGGIIARCYSTQATEASVISGCINNGSVKTNNYYVGAIIGTADSHKVSVTNCKNFGAITTGAAAADGSANAVFGYAVQSGNVTESGNEGTTSAAEDATLATALLADTLISKTASSENNNNNNNNNGSADTDNNNDSTDTGNNSNTETDGTANTTDNGSAATEGGDGTEAVTDEGGCGSAIGAGIVIMTVLAGAGAVVCKKRK
ncbi:MAG: hypothetical protein IJY08_03470 [Clostridia bacterium]|nr:hypothetical protein [Clostridia bacterium]